MQERGAEMSKFSVYLKELLDQRGEPIARVAKNVGIERTSIYKALKDERTMPYTALKKLIQYLQLTLSQVWELNQYYEMLLQGEDIYRIQEAICDLLGELSHLHFSGYQKAGFPAAQRDMTDVTGLICGKSQVESVIRTVLRWEVENRKGAELSLYLPSHSDLTDSLPGLWQNGENFAVRQLVSFKPNHSGAGTHVENLHLLQNILPLAFVSGGSYFAYYYFENSTVPVNINPLSYFIITPNYLITMDTKMSAAQFQTDTSLIQLYEKRFRQILTECQPLNSYSSQPEYILEAYMQSTDEDGYYTLMPQPCLGHYYTRERIERQFLDVPGLENLIELSDRRMERLRNLNSNYYTIFSEEGLRSLAQNGVMVDLPSEFVKPFSLKLRWELFCELRKDIEADVIRGCLADTEKLPIPPYLTFTCDPRYGVHIYAVQSFIGGAYACNLHIEESSIGQTFCEFIRSLPNSKFVYPKERTLAVLDELIRDMEEAMEKGDENID